MGHPESRRGARGGVEAGLEQHGEGGWGWGVSAQQGPDRLREEAGAASGPRRVHTSWSVRRGKWKMLLLMSKVLVMGWRLA